MSLENNEAHDPSLSDRPPGHPASTGAVNGAQNLTGTPPLDWDFPTEDPAAKAKAKADWEAAKEQAVHAEPSTLTRADRFARHQGRKDLRAAGKAATQGQAVNAMAAAGQVVDAADTVQGADAVASESKARKPRTAKGKDQAPATVKVSNVNAVAKPAPKTRASAKAAAADTQVQAAGAEAVKPARKRVKVVSKGFVQAKTQPSSDAVPTIDCGEIPAPTEEAIKFLGNPHAKAADLFKLQPESIAFVQFHIARQQRFEVESQANYNYLMSNVHKRLANAWIGRLVKDQPTNMKSSVAQVQIPIAAQKRGVSYRPKLPQVGGQQFTPVQLGKMDIGLALVAAQEQQASADRAADLQRANRVIGTAQVMMSAPIGDVTREQAADLVVGDVKDFHIIKDERVRRLALNSMIESSHAQPHYKDAFERLAPDLVAAAKEANTAIEADRDAPSRSVPKASEQDADNTIEAGIATERENQPGRDSRQSTPSVDPFAPGATRPALGFGKRMLRAMVAWLQGKAEDKPATAPASGDKPLSLDKPEAAATPAAADDKANAVPDAVARRFLKVERDYYFPDRTPAFSDRGNKLATRGAHPEVVRSLVEIAQARGWDSITVKGTDEFRRSAWMEATQAGLKVAGYKPTALDLAELSSKPATNTVEKGLAKEREASAAQKSSAQPSEPTAAAQADASKTADSALNPELEAKARAFEKEKPGFVMRKYPELAQAYGVVDAAKKFAEASLPQDVREEFVSLARRHVMQKILAGEQVKGPRIYTAPAKAKDDAEQTQAPAQSAVDLGKSARSKEVARER